ncbi:MAG: class I SAM-dependent methyltransferase [Phycisphaerales bacterium JB043]
MNDDLAPLPIEHHEAQLADLLEIVRPATSLLDLGAGNGRTALPLRDHGVDVFCVDNNSESLEHLRVAELPHVECDFLRAGWEHALDHNRFDTITILGNTLMLVHDVDHAVELLTTLRMLIDDRGVLVIDAIPQMHWIEVSEGYWINGIDESGETEFRWAPDDNVFTLRKPGTGDDKNDGFHQDDRLHRLWTMGELSLLARASGWNPPTLSRRETLLVFEPA